MAIDWYGLDPDGLATVFEELGQPAFRGNQVFEALQARQVGRFADITGLPGALREQLDAADAPTGPLEPATEVARQESRDGTVKSLLQFADGRKAECVSIPTATRHTICVSSQVGCPVGCTFCASGINGVDRDLTAGEIVYQVLHHQRHRPVTNIVFMGSGEPLFNYANVRTAINLLAHPRGLGLGKRRFTVSTSGVPGKIRQLGEDEPQVTLALSLHAPDDETRSRLVPLNRRWPLADLMAAMQDYAGMVNRRITLEYVPWPTPTCARTRPLRSAASLALRRPHQPDPVQSSDHKSPPTSQLGRGRGLRRRRRSRRWRRNCAWPTRRRYRRRVRSVGDQVCGWPGRRGLTNQRTLISCEHPRSAA